MAAEADAYVRLPLECLTFPVELRPPPGFDPGDLATWPLVDGRLEYVDGKLLYMPPCGDRQAVTSIDLAYAIRRWVDDREEFVVGGLEAGMMFGRDVRGADAAVWRRADLGPFTGGVPRVAPVLAAEVAGRFQGETSLRAKAAWYFARGVRVVWILLPTSREVIVLDRDQETRHRAGEVLREHPDLPGLAPAVNDLYRQLGP